MGQYSRRNWLCSKKNGCKRYGANCAIISGPQRQQIWKIQRWNLAWSNHDEPFWSVSMATQYWRWWSSNFSIKTYDWENLRHRDSPKGSFRETRTTSILKVHGQVNSFACAWRKCCKWCHSEVRKILFQTRYHDFKLGRIWRTLPKYWQSENTEGLVDRFCNPYYKRLETEKNKSRCPQDNRVKGAPNQRQCYWIKPINRFSRGFASRKVHAREMWKEINCVSWDLMS